MKATINTIFGQFGRFFTEFHSEDSGQDLLEYALVLAAVLSVVVIGSGTLQGTITAELTKINLAIQALQVP